jgi:hypothetical protein
MSVHVFSYIKAKKAEIGKFSALDLNGGGSLDGCRRLRRLSFFVEFSFERYRGAAAWLSEDLAGWE